MAQATVVNKKSGNKNEPERCERCGAVVVETYCKIMCTNCGYMRDCNDQW